MDVKIKLKFKTKEGQEIEIEHSEAEELYLELKKYFEKKTKYIPYRTYPTIPISPIWPMYTKEVEYPLEVRPTWCSSSGNVSLSKGE